MSTTENIRLEPEILRDHLEKFTMRGLPLLSGGAVTQPLVICENLWLSSKVYSEGGENALHTHSNDDHAFFILAGRARFFDGDGGEIEVGPLEGILIPSGVAYRFQSVPPENLVILRMAGAEDDYYTLRARHQRFAPDGSLLDSKDPRNGTPAQQVVETGDRFGE